MASPSPAPADARPLLKRRTRYTRWLVVAIVPLLAVSAPPADRPDWTHELLEVVGIVALVVCLVGRVWCSVYIAGRKGHELVTHGPYAVVRNPLYVFSFVGLVGVGLISEMLSLLALAALVFIVYYRRVVAGEEAYLAALHGEAFGRYVARVPRWWPRFSAWRDVEALDVRPRLIAFHLRDSSLFFLSFLFFELTEFLHDAGIVPVLLHLP